MLHARTLAVLIAGLALPGCGEAGPRSIDASVVPVRLVEVLGRASIQSPLSTIDAVSGVQDLEAVQRELVFSEDFETFDPEDAGWPVTDTAGVEEEDGNRVFGAGEVHAGRRYTWVVPAQPHTYYVFERRIRPGDAADLDFTVIERASGTRAAKRVHDAFAEIRLRRHWLPRPPADGEWHRSVVSFFSTSSTRSMTIELRARPRGERAGMRWRWKGGEGGERTLFDDIRLYRVEPDREQMISLLASASPAGIEGAPPGVAKRGQFPPILAAKSRVRVMDVNHAYRDALYAPPPSDLGFPVVVGEDTTLRCAVALWARSTAGAAARYEVVVREGGREEVVWSSTLRADGDDWRWQDVDVPLGAFAGRSITLVLRTRAESGNPQPVWGSPVLDVPPTGEGPRNVILIAVDTLRADRLSCYGYRKATTPRLDALAADAVRFENCQSNANWTCPSFASIFTGLVPARHGVLMYGPSTPLPDALDTVAELFRREGWATQSIVYKVPLYNGGYEQGFDVALNIPRFYITADANLSQALAWLKANRERRNFLFLHFNDPHQPFTLPPPFDRKFGDVPGDHGVQLPVKIPLGGDKPEEPERRELMRSLYDGSIAFVDDRIGAFLDALEKEGLYEDAVIGFVSDHGEQFWERGQFGHGFEFMHDEVVRVPLMVKAGRDGPSGAVVPTQVRGFDVMPTLLELAGIDLPDDIDAQSLVPLLGADVDAPDRRAVAESSFGSLAMRTRHWKYIRVLGAKSVPEEGLYDLRVDPGETEDLFVRRPKIAARMRVAVMDYWMSKKAGTFLVSVADEGVADRSVQVANVQAASAVFGAVPEKTADGVYRIACGGGLSVEFMADLKVEPGGVVTVDGVDHAVADIPRYEDGELARLLAEGEPGILLFRGPPPLAAVEQRSGEVDLQQLEALKELGYTGK